MAKPTKFTFNPGDDIPAESFNTIDPDNISADPTDDAYKLVRLDERGKNISNNNIEYEALEDISKGDNVFIAENWADVVKTSENTNTDDNYEIKSTSLKAGQTFTAKYSSDQTIVELRFRIFSSGDFTSASLYATDENGLPTGGAIETVSAVASDYQMSGTQNRKYIFTFTTQLTIGTKYAIVFNTSGTATNYAIMDYGASSITDGELIYNDGDGWDIISGYDLNITIYEKDVYSDKPYILKSSNAIIERAKFAGKASHDALKGETLKIETDIIDDASYNLNDLFFLGVDGGDTSTPTGYSIKIGYSLEDGWLNLSQEKVVADLYENGSFGYSLGSVSVSQDRTEILGYYKVMFTGTHYFRFSSATDGYIKIYKNATLLGAVGDTDLNASISLTKNDILVITAKSDYGESGNKELLLDNDLM
jgi:hypothetical protein